MKTTGKILLGIAATALIIFAVVKVFGKNAKIAARKLTQDEADKLVLQIETIKTASRLASGTFPNAWQLLVIQLNEAGYMYQERAEKIPPQAVYKGGIYHQYPNYKYSDQEAVIPIQMKEGRFAQALGSANAFTGKYRGFADEKKGNGA